MSEGVVPLEPLTEREEKIWRLHCVNRWSNAEIGAAEDPPISDVRVSQILKAVRSKLPPVNLEDVRQQSIRLLQDIQRRAFEIADMRGVPVTAGKDGFVLHDPEDDSVARDYSGRLRAMTVAMDADAQIRKLLGADAASKVESTGTVKYELVGIDLEALR